MMSSSSVIHWTIENNVVKITDEMLICFNQKKHMAIYFIFILFADYTHFPLRALQLVNVDVLTLTKTVPSVYV